MLTDAAPLAVRFQPASDQTLLLYFGDGISLTTHRSITTFVKVLSANPIPGVVNFQPAYTSVLIKFDPRTTEHGELEALCHERLRQIEHVCLPVPRLREIPVCYGEQFGPDLQAVAELHSVAVDEVVRLHSSATYTAYFLGFVPGFAYL